MNLAQLESEVFALSVEERAALVKRLLLSLEDVSDEEFDNLWGEESARRVAEFDAGMIQVAFDFLQNRC